MWWLVVWFVGAVLTAACLIDADNTPGFPIQTIFFCAAWPLTLAMACGAVLQVCVIHSWECYRNWRKRRSA